MSINNLSTFTIRGTLKAYKGICPSSPLSEAAIREAVRNGELKSRKVGNTSYILWGNFLHWLGVEDEGL